MGILNGRADRVFSEPILACLLIFFMGLVLAIAITPSTESDFPDFKSHGQLKEIEYFGGFAIA